MITQDLPNPISGLKHWPVTSHDPTYIRRLVTRRSNSSFDNNERNNINSIYFFYLKYLVKYTTHGKLQNSKTDTVLTRLVMKWKVQVDQTSPEEHGLRDTERTETTWKDVCLNAKDREGSKKRTAQYPGYRKD